MKRSLPAVLAAVFFLSACGIFPPGKTEPETAARTEEERREAETAETEAETQEAETETAEAETETAETETETAETETAESETAEAGTEKPETAEPGIEESGTEEPETTAPEEQFYITGISDELMSRIRGKSYKEDCTVPREDLRYLHVLHRDLTGKTLEGEMICNRYIAEDLLEILRELYENDYPIEKIRLVDEYDADDSWSMSENNSSCFNFRRVSYTTHLSKHSYGLAVDINPLYNPYVKWVDGRMVVDPINGEPYLDRDRTDIPYKITRDDLCCRLFFEHGFNWGGDWENSKDYQHFEIPSETVRRLYPD